MASADQTNRGATKDPKNDPRKTFLKYLSLGLLIPHTILYTLLASVARKPDAQGHVFFGPSAVVVMELGKMCVSILGVVHDASQSQNQGSIQNSSRGDYVPITGRNGSTSNFVISESSNKDDEELDQEIQDLKTEMENNEATDRFSGSNQMTSGSEKLSISQQIKFIISTIKKEVLIMQAFRLIPPALLYVCQNNLQVFSAGCLTPAEYQIVGQSKLAFTAIFSVLILKRKLNWKHWSSIAMLALGTIIVQVISASQITKSQALATPIAPSDADAEGTTIVATQAAAAVVRSKGSLLIGTLAMLGASACSGLGGVLVEVLLKTKMPFWTTNVHLAFFSLLPAILPVFIDCIMNASFDPFRYFTLMVYCLIGFNILGGIIASMSMKYADNILKNFAVAISLIGTVFLSSLVSGIPVTFVQLFGTALVVGAVVGYARA